jgi:hypothetical protein
MLDSERLSGCEKLMDDLAMLGFEPSAFRRCESLVRDEKIADGFQRVPHEAQFLFEATVKRGDIGGGSMRGAHRIERRRQKRLPLIRMLKGAIGADQGERFPAFQAQVAPVDEADHCFAQPLCHQQTGRHPRCLSPQNMGDSLGTEPLRVSQGMHHPRFVHRRERTRRAIRFEQRDLPLQAG